MHDERNGQIASDPESFITGARLSWQRNLALRDPRTPPAAAPASLPTAFTLAEYQTPSRSQDDRDTCWAFAALAALEAAYKRDHGLELDLSEQYFVHICRATSLPPDYMTTVWQSETATSLWGGGGSSSSIGSLGVWWVPLETYAPYQSEADLLDLANVVGVGNIPWEPSTTQETIDIFEWDDRLVPRIARWNCVYGVTSIEALPDTSVDSIKSVLVSGHEVVVDIAAPCKTDSSGRYIYQSPPGGGHVLVVIGFDDNDEDGTFAIKNSWGAGFPARISYDYFTHNDSYYGGNYITGIVAPGAAPQRQAFWLGRWNQDNDGQHGTHIFRRFTDPSKPTKLGNFYRSDGTRLDVNGWVDQLGQRAVYWVADNPGRVHPGSQAGRGFNTWVFNGDPPIAAGTMLVNERVYGALMSRDPLQGTSVQGFNRDYWLGTWHMEHDGWRGTLAITGFGGTDLSGHVETYVSYSPEGGAPLPTSGYILADAEHHLTLSVSFSSANAQPFDLFHATFESNEFAGATLWNQEAFGAMGHLAVVKQKEKEKDKEKEKEKELKELKEKDAVKEHLKESMAEKITDRSFFSATTPPPLPISELPGDIGPSQTSFIRPEQRPDVG